MGSPTEEDETRAAERTNCMASMMATAMESLESERNRVESTKSR